MKKDKNYKRITIERWGEDKDGHITFIDLHDEKFGEAVFFNDQGVKHHFHGFENIVDSTTPIDNLVRDITKVPVTKSKTRKLITQYLNKLT